MNCFFAVTLTLLALTFAGCARKPEGVYKSTGKLLGVEITYQADFRPDGTCYYSSGDSSRKCTWKQNNGTVTIFDNGQATETFQFDGNDLVPMSGDKERRFVKQ